MIKNLAQALKIQKKRIKAYHWRFLDDDHCHVCGREFIEGDPFEWVQCFEIYSENSLSSGVQFYCDHGDRLRKFVFHADCSPNRRIVS